MYSRRTVIKRLIAVASVFSISPSWAFLDENYPKVTALTKNPGYHWFGYYDKLQTDPTGRFVLAMQTSFEGRTPAPEDVIIIGYIDTKKKNKWVPVGTSKSWGWQQGCMLQWLPGSDREIIWNDRIEDKFVAHIYDIHSGEKRTIPAPVYALSADGKTAITTDFARLQNMRPGYGYVGLPDKYENIKSPDENGIFRVDLSSGVKTLLMSYAQAAEIPHKGEKLDEYWHWFNHLLINPSGNRFTFLHRWREGGQNPAYRATGGFITRMFTLNMDGTHPFIIDPSGYTSHFVWRDDGHITAWTKPVDEVAGFYLLEDKTSKFTPIGKGIMTLNGHNTYVPETNNEWILCDTYPIGKERFQEMYLYHVPTGRKVVLGKFHETENYKGEWRCDLHQKCTPDGNKVLFDSTHELVGRQIYMIDIKQFIR